MSNKDQQARRRRFIASIPFSSTCRSRSSVDVVVVDTARRHAGKNRRQGSESAGPAGGGAPGKGESLVARLLRGFKNLSSRIFAVHDEEEEEEEREMVIGLPTDVKHVAHMGWDGSTNTTASLRSWNRAATAPQQEQQQQAAAAVPLPPLPALSMRQFELAMAAQAAATTDSTAGHHRRHS